MTGNVSEYAVSWEIDVDAVSPMQAAIEAREAMMDPRTTALIFDVTDRKGRTWRVDLVESTCVELKIAGDGTK